MESNLKLIKMLEPHIFPEYEYGIKNIEEYRKNNQKAKEFLAIFYKELQSIPLEKKKDICFTHNLHTIHMMRCKSYQERIRLAFEEDRYTTVCSEIQSFIQHLPIEQPDIHANVLKTLETFLE